MMDILYQFTIFCISLVVLAKSSQIVVNNSVKIARITRLGELVIGFILLSVATSVPELAVSLSAQLSGDVGISVGNLIGSNVANLGLVLSVSAIITPIIITRGSFGRLLSILFLSSMIPLVLFSLAEVSSIVGVFLVATFVVFSAYSIKKKITLKLPKKRLPTLAERLLLPATFYKYLFFIGLALVGVILSSHFLVSSASNIAEVFNIASTVIGATIIAVGTSMPELSVTITAARSKHYQLAAGNVIGSCLTNLTLILGILLVMSPFTVNMSIFSTILLFVISVTMISWYFFSTGRTLDRKEGIFLLLIYIIFLMSTFGAQIIVG